MSAVYKLSPASHTVCRYEFSGENSSITIKSMFWILRAPGSMPTSFTIWDSNDQRAEPYIGHFLLKPTLKGHLYRLTGSHRAIYKNEIKYIIIVLILSS